MSEATDSIRLVVDRAFERYRTHDNMQSTLIPLLQDIQSELGYLPEQALERVSQLLRLPTSHIYGVATFYHQFRLRPKGRHMITVCRGTACHVKGSLDVNELIMSELGITQQADTSRDGAFTLQQVRCVGACSLAPVMKIDEEFYGNVDPAKVRRILSKYGMEEADRR
ncbi:MAG TPA: NADH-quinone oxidoreductase subunit NuoE [Candidatus Desulfaltia sp.]|nr:NADH-quinone oxidoreductase subunit NuoE [Candidatus Desulfaltia sp.]